MPTTTFSKGNGAGADMRFTRGRVANPLGRPKRVETLRREIARELARHGGVLTRMAIDRALKGDVQCLAGCLNLLAVTSEHANPASTEDIARKGSTQRQ
jgi:hypothetical protein